MIRNIKFSLISLLTLTSAVGWITALSMTPALHQGTFVAVSLLVVIGIMFVTAMLSPSDGKGMIDYERSLLN